MSVEHEEHSVVFLLESFNGMFSVFQLLYVRLSFAVWTKVPFITNSNNMSLCS